MKISNPCQVSETIPHAPTCGYAIVASFSCEYAEPGSELKQANTLQPATMSEVVPQTGLEPVTYGLEGRCSIL